jgi:squalene-hopene/tetraprenyl-beta-curcumene cyclase
MKCSSGSGTLFALCLGLLTGAAMPALSAEPPPEAQYRHGDIVVPAFHADEPRRKEVSVELAEAYLSKGATAWAGSHGCVSCHTTGTYLTARPALTPHLGPPLESMRSFFVAELRRNLATPREELLKSTKPAQVIYLAAGLAEWDAHVSHKLSPETRDALSQMLDLQLDSGTWGTLDCWPPYESDAFHLAAQAAMALGTAPGWRKNVANEKERARVEKLFAYLRDTPPPHDYGRVLLLWAAARLPELLTSDRQKELLAMISRHQRPDGGWSMRTFAAPEAWGRGNRAKKLRDEPDFAVPPSDGHQTGLALVVLREHGIPVGDPRVQAGLRWLKSNQRESGRWWTRSLNNDAAHYITYSGTALPLLALGLCDEIPAPGTRPARQSAALHVSPREP